MKISIFGIAILSGWLYSELKDFLMNGGLENKLAIIILKILFISLFIFVLAFVDLNQLLLSKKHFENSSHDFLEKTDQTILNNDIKKVRSTSKTPIRKNRFMACLSE